MEFNEKLQELRKREGMTQEQLAEALFVSRAAVSKWESGRGYPSIDSLREISRYFSVSLDDLLSSESLLALAEDESKRKAERSLSRTLGLIDCATLLLAFLPIFSRTSADIVLSVPLLSILSDKPVFFGIYALLISASVLMGIAALVLARRPQGSPASMRPASLAVSCICVLAFILTRQVYAAVAAFAFLAMKVFLLIRRP